MGHYAVLKNEQMELMRRLSGESNLLPSLPPELSPCNLRAHGVERGQLTPKSYPLTTHTQWYMHEHTHNDNG